jgi:hypothetical protein
MVSLKDVIAAARANGMSEGNPVAHMSVVRRRSAEIFAGTPARKEVRLIARFISGRE